MVDLSRQAVINKIEELSLELLIYLKNGEMLNLQLLKRRQEEMTFDNETSQLIHSGATKTIRLSSLTARKYVAVWLVLKTTHELLLECKTVNQREIYYMYPFFKNQAEADEAILGKTMILIQSSDCGSLLGLPRECLGISASIKGAFMGNLFLKIKGEWKDCRVHENGGIPITQDILSLKEDEISSDARYIIVIEKDGIFNRLSEDMFINQVSSILITGKGFPDLPTRMLSDTLKIPVLGVSDCNPFGLALMFTYKLGSARMPIDSPLYTIDVKWIGLHPSTLNDLNLPSSVFQSFTKKDQNKVDSLLELDFVKSSPRYFYELSIMKKSQIKVDLEALHSRGFDFISLYLRNVIKKAEYF